LRSSSLILDYFFACRIQLGLLAGEVLQLPDLEQMSHSFCRDLACDFLQAPERDLVVETNSLCSDDLR
jgi:hypothetical protein